MSPAARSPAAAPLGTRIALLGWGSLLWDLDDLAPWVEGAWRLGAGPRFPLEFSRVSAKRLGSLTVVLDDAHGALCPTHAIVSVREGIHAAAQDLARRERCTLARIGALCLESGFERAASPGVSAHVAAWCRAEGWRGAVWTDLESNFAESTGTAFSLEAGAAYLRTLKGAALDEAVRYITEAPAATDTPLRRALEEAPWWQAARTERGY
ncbi:MAG: hypothetical protein AAGI34_07040 [Pseudomonadota bacterium]